MGSGRLGGSPAPLVTAGVARLAVLWGSDPPVEEVVVDHADRAVFTTTAPGGRPVYVKLERSRRRALRETAGLAAASCAGVPVPDVVHAELSGHEPGGSASGLLDAALGRALHAGDRRALGHDQSTLSVLVLAAVPGRALVADERAGSWVAAARELAALHRIEPGPEVERFDHREDDWISFMRWWLADEAAQVNEAGMLDRDTTEALHRRADQVLATMAVPPRRLLHGDCQPDHVLLDGDHVSAFVDWGDASSGDPRWDLATLTCRHPDRWLTVRDAYYLDAGGPDADCDEVVKAYCAVRHLGSATWMAEHGFDPTPALRAATSLAGTW